MARAKRVLRKVREGQEELTLVSASIWLLVTFLQWLLVSLSQIVKT